jgi:DNA primase
MEKNFNAAITELLARVDIIEIVSGYLPLKRLGRNYKANCPFHKEKTPSFVVSPDKQIFHCFGCNVGGNAISFVSKYESLSFYEAAKKLAKQFNVELPTFKQNKEKDNLYEKITSILLDSALFYNKCLKSKQFGKSARDYFVKRRINKDIIDEFQLGYAPDAWDSLLEGATKKGYLQKELITAGVVIEKKNNKGCYDRFRNRMIFPIHNILGNVIGFGARVLDESLPKYINSPENFVFNKRKNLYGLHKSKKYIIEKKTVILVEGYLDFLCLYQAGIKNVAATLGTALTPEHARLLKRFSSKVFMLYDADKAGIAAVDRNIDILLEQDFAIKTATLEQAKDPDEYIVKFGVDRFKKFILENTKDFFRFKLDILLKEYEVNTSEGKTDIANKLLKTIGKIKNDILRHEYIKKIAKTLDIKEEILSKQKVVSVEDTFVNKKTFKRNLEKKSKKILRIEQAEKILLKLILDNEEYCYKIISLINKHKCIFILNELNLIIQIFEKQGYLSCKDVFVYIEDEEIKQSLSEILMATINIENFDRLLNDCFKAVILFQIDKEIIELTIKQKQAIENNKDIWQKVTEEIALLQKNKININKEGVFSYGEKKEPK